MRESTLKGNYPNVRLWLYLNLICDHWGHLPIAGVHRKHVLALRDHFGDTPAKANSLVMVLRVLLAFAVDRGLRHDNSAVGIKKLKTGTGYEALAAMGR